MKAKKREGYQPKKKEKNVLIVNYKSQLAKYNVPRSESLHVKRPSFQQKKDVVAGNSLDCDRKFNKLKVDFN